ncbi:MAG: hypothetical protein HYS56_02025 [Candidatus Omnitrophica bacterium]|nr:hypothetical protein [Candidatus Omnitrophota bacterium]
METHPYFELLGQLTKQKARYCVVGLLGASFYGSTLSTYDLDLVVEPTEETLEKIRLFFHRQKFSEIAVYHGEILKQPPTHGEVLRKKMTLLFTDSYGLSIDVMTQISGIDFKTVWQKRKKFSMQGRQICVASLEHILLSKQKAGREKDLLHVRRLQEMLIEGQNRRLGKRIKK